jgi:predicted AAA+ superfamily ATPase
MLDLKPLSFKEFLMASNQHMLVDYMESIDLKDEMSMVINDKINRYLSEYLITGGMPEVVQTWIDTRDIQAVEQIQENINNAYYKDFSKYPERGIVPKILGIWDSIVVQLSKENRKFMYSEVSKNARAREYEGALEWLLAGNYLRKIPMVKKMLLPLKGYEHEKHFKIYMPDIGLLRQMAVYPASALLDENETNLPFKGGL